MNAQQEILRLRQLYPEWTFTSAPGSDRVIIAARAAEDAFSDVRLIANEVDLSSFELVAGATRLAMLPENQAAVKEYARGLEQQHATAGDFRKNWNQVKVEEHPDGGIPGLDFVQLEDIPQLKVPGSPWIFWLRYRRWLMLLMIHDTADGLVWELHGSMTYADGESQTWDGGGEYPADPTQPRALMTNIMNEVKRAVDLAWDHEGAVRQAEIMAWEGMIRDRIRHS